MTVTSYDIFKRVRDHLQMQRSTSINAGGICFYRGLKGKSCAVGCLITDAAYDPQAEGVSVSSLLVSKETEKWIAADFYDRNGQEFNSAKALAKSLDDSGIPATHDVWVTLMAVQSFHDDDKARVGDFNWEDGLDDLEKKLSQQLDWSTV